MVRVYLVLVVLAVAFTVYTIVAASLADRDRVRTLPKHLWVLLTIVLPVIGGALWLTLGRPAADNAAVGTAYETAPGGGADRAAADLHASRVAESDAIIADLERRLQELDAEEAAAKALNNEAEATADAQPHAQAETAETTDKTSDE